jgi:hypothetical protein
MDPVSITVSVVALLELTKKVANYAKQVKDASADRDRVFKEASSLTGLLILLKDDVEDRDGDAQDPWLQATSRLTTADGPLHQYKLALEMVVAKVMPSHGHHRFKQAVTWRFSKEEVTSLLLQMERVKSLIHIALEIDHTFVLLLVTWSRYVLTGTGNSRVRSVLIYKRSVMISSTSKYLPVSPWTTLP